MPSQLSPIPITEDRYDSSSDSEESVMPRPPCFDDEFDDEDHPTRCPFHEHRKICRTPDCRTCSECDPRIKRIEPDRLPCFCDSVYDCDKYHRRRRRHRKRQSSSAGRLETPQPIYIPVIPGPAMVVPAVPVGCVPAMPVAVSPLPSVQIPLVSLHATVGQSSTRLGSEYGPYLATDMYTVPQPGVMISPLVAARPMQPFEMWQMIQRMG